MDNRSCSQWTVEAIERTVHGIPVRRFLVLIDFSLWIQFLSPSPPHHHPFPPPLAESLMLTSKTHTRYSYFPLFDFQSDIPWWFKPQVTSLSCVSAYSCFSSSPIVSWRAKYKCWNFEDVTNFRTLLSSKTVIEVYVCLRVEDIVSWCENFLIMNRVFCFVFCLFLSFVFLHWKIIVPWCENFLIMNGFFRWTRRSDEKQIEILVLKYKNEALDSGNFSLFTGRRWQAKA